MAFPTTSILDDFNRADTPDITGSLSWIAGPFGFSGCAIVSDHCNGGISGYRGNAWNQSFTDLEIYITFIDVLHADDEVWLGARIDPVGVANGYYLVWFYNSGSQFLRLLMFDGSQHAIGADAPVSLVDGDGIGMSLVGDNFTLYTQHGGVWSNVATRTDSTYSSAGLLNLFLHAGIIYVDDFGGGTVAPALAIPILMNQYRQRR